MNATPLVTIVIPTHNRPALLQQAVESALAQTYAKIEIIVVADGCSDDTAQRMQAYSGRLRLIEQPQRGVSAARNAGLAAARGEWINFLDDDDLLYPEKIAQQIAALQNEPAVGLVHCRYDHIDHQGRFINRMGPLPSGDVLGQLLCRQFVWMGGPLIRRTRLEEVGGFYETLSTAADYDLWLRIALAGWPFVCVQQSLGAYRVHLGSMVTNIAKIETEVLPTLERAFAHPLLPAELHLLRAEAFATWRFWLSRRYYATAAWGPARANLSEALRLYPSLMDNETTFLDAWVNEALDARVNNPLNFIENTWAHLPPEVIDRLHVQVAHLQRRVHLGLALQAYAYASKTAGQEILRQAIARNPGLLHETFLFRQAAVQAAMQWAIDPQAFVHALFAGLPLEARPLKRVYAKVLADVCVGRAFEADAAGQRQQARRLLLPTIFRYPAWLKNRGVWAILFKEGVA